jgi:alanine racemase
MTTPLISIDHANLRHNVATLASLVAPSEVMLAVKTNAYGHGLVEVCKTALDAGATRLAVLEISAAIELRAAGISAPLFAWLFADDEIHAGIENQVDLGISRREQLVVAGSIGTPVNPAFVHLKIDTGLTRNGATIDQWAELCEEAARLEKLGNITVIGIWTHLADATPQDDEDALEVFRAAVEVARHSGLTPSLLHAGASSAGLRFDAGRLDAVRFGIAAYGISPFDSPTAEDLGLRRVMTVSAPVMHVDADYALVGMGFGHGILTGDSDDRFVRLGSDSYRVTDIGVDSMRIVPFENSPWPVTLGERAIVFGDGGPSAEQLGAWCGTIGDEVVTSVSPHIRRTHN